MLSWLIFEYLPNSLVSWFAPCRMNVNPSCLRQMKVTGGVGIHQQCDMTIEIPCPLESPSHQRAGFQYHVWPVSNGSESSQPGLGSMRLPALYTLQLGQQSPSPCRTTHGQEQAGTPRRQGLHTPRKATLHRGEEQMSMATWFFTWPGSSAMKPLCLRCKWIAGPLTVKARRANIAKHWEQNLTRR